MQITRSFSSILNYKLCIEKIMKKVISFSLIILSVIANNFLAPESEQDFI